jgi:putative membrane protein
MLNKLSTTAIPGLLALIAPVQAIAQQAQAPDAPVSPQYYWPGPWHMWGVWPFGPIMMIVFVMFCMAMMYFMMGGMHHRFRGDHALELLNERFARGEINQAEYEERKRLLKA